jgi:hypothetical protein
MRPVSHSSSILELVFGIVMCVISISIIGLSIFDFALLQRIAQRRAPSLIRWGKPYFHWPMSRGGVIWGYSALLFVGLLFVNNVVSLCGEIYLVIGLLLAFFGSIFAAYFDYRAHAKRNPKH